MILVVVLHVIFVWFVSVSLTCLTLYFSRSRGWQQTWQQTWTTGCMKQYYSGQEVPDHLAPYSVVRYYYNTTPSRVLVVEPHTMPISHGGPRVVLHGNGNRDFEVLEELMAKNPYWVNKGVLMTSKVPSGILNYKTYQIFLIVQWRQTEE